MKRFTDVHSHFVYGIDDGAHTKQDMVDMLEAAYADGIAVLYATPHVTPGYKPFPEERFLRHLNEAQAYCQQQGYDMTLHPGAEVLYTPLARQHILNHRLQTLDFSDVVLMEFVPDISMKEIEDALELMDRAGYQTILAHAERYATLFHGKNATLLKRNFDVRFQINCSTLLKKQHFWQGPGVRLWFEQGLVDIVSSDAHNCTTRPYRMSAAFEVLCGWIGNEGACGLMESR